MTTKVIAKSWKMIIAAVLAAILLSVSLPFAASAVDNDYFEIDSLSYYVTSEPNGTTPGTVMVSVNESVEPDSVTAVTIPGTVSNEGSRYVVTQISENAFGGCTSLGSLDISDCTELTSIGQGTFYDCEKLNSIAVPCTFDSALFNDTGVVLVEGGFKIEYVVMGGEVLNPTTVTLVTDGVLTYVHNWKVNDKNYAEHKCLICGEKASHSWEPDKDNASQHICTVCKYTEAHYGTADCNGNAKCPACSAEFKTEKGSHAWNVIAETIGTTTADYKCESCKSVEVQKIDFSEYRAKVDGQSVKTILQDPYKVLPDNTSLKTTVISKDSERYDELLSQLDDDRDSARLALFELELYSIEGRKISGPLNGNVRILIQIPDGWAKDDLQAVLIMDKDDISFEESIITIDGVDYLAFWTNHFSPYAVLSKSVASKSPATGSPSYSLIPLYVLASAPAVIIAYVIYRRKRRAV